MLNVMTTAGTRLSIDLQLSIWSGTAGGRKNDAWILSAPALLHTYPRVAMAFNCSRDQQQQKTTRREASAGRVEFLH